MCGISGIIDFSKRSSEKLLRKMSDALQHRGPDGSGLLFFDNSNFQIGLAHRRLSIIDLSELGKQPMQFGKLSVTYNGEIYNFKEIRSELEKEGQRFISNSDTEVLLHAYSKWGLDSVHKFIGMFAFVIYDEEKEEVVCVRDRAGIKPFYYYWKDGLFLFSSELKSFHLHTSFVKEIELDAVAAYMQFGNVPTPHCIFKNCFKLKPAHTLKLSLKTKQVEIKEYWSVYDSYNKKKLDISFDEAKIATEKILASAAEYRMVADVPVGIFLSGGYDSTCLTALLQKNRASKLKTYTIGVPDAGLNEAPYAKIIAKQLGTDHSEYYCDQKEALELIPMLPYYYDEPFGDQSAIPTTLVSKMAHKSVTVALSADGGDEVFAGYNRYDYLMKYGRMLDQSPAFLKRSLHSILKAVPAEKIPVLKDRYNFYNRYEKLKMLVGDPSTKNLMLSLSRQFSDDQLEKLFVSKIKTIHTAFLNEELKDEFATPLSYMMAIDYQTYLPDDILQKVDRASMSQSLEAREPFLDHRLIEWAAQLPDHFKYHNGNKKYIVKEIVHQYLPKKLMDRPKMGFTIPLENWLMNDLKPQIMQHLNDSTIKAQGIFDPRSIQTLVKAFYSGRKELALKLWYLLMFQIWYEKWMK